MRCLWVAVVSKLRFGAKGARYAAYLTHICCKNKYSPNKLLITTRHKPYLSGVASIFSLMSASSRTYFVTVSGLRCVNNSYYLLFIAKRQFGSVIKFLCAGLRQFLRQGMAGLKFILQFGQIRSIFVMDLCCEKGQIILWRGLIDTVP